MEYKINPRVYSSMVPLPVDLIDNNLKLASASQLKTILYFFRKAALGAVPSVEEIAAAIGYQAEDVADALIFWEERGLLVKDGEPVSFLEPASESESGGTVEPAKQAAEELPLVKPSFEQVSQRLKEDDDVKVLFTEAQGILGKTIGYSGQSIFLMIHDSYGMPVEVILMMIQYAKSIGRTGYSYISGIAKKWADEEILTVEDAEEYLKRQSRIDDLWRRFRELSSIGNEIPTTKQRQYFLKWNSEYGFSVQMIYLAYERAVEQTGKFSLPYADKVLKSWNEAGLKTEADVAAAEAARAKQKEKAAKPAKKTETVFSQKSSYDLSEIEKLGIKKKKD